MRLTPRTAPAALPRRRLLGGALLGGVALAAGSLSTGCAPAPAPLVVSAGEPGGFYVEFAHLLVARLAAAGLPATAVETAGSVDNLRHVADGTAALGLALVDAAQSAVSGTEPFVGPLPVRALGRVYENYMQLVVRAEDPVHGLADLAGRPVSLGAAGSGAATFGDRLLATAGVAAGVQRRGLRDATAALAAGDTDALLWSGGVPTPALAELAARRPVRLLPLGEHLPALRAAYGPVYGPATVPAGGYPGVPAVATVGVANLLVCAAGLAAATAAEVVTVLVTDAPALVPESALGAQYLDQRSLIGTDPVALHPGAAAAYRDLHG